jgi:hypothetical protein
VISTLASQSAAGVFLISTNSGGNTVLGNYIGINAAGNAVLGVAVGIAVGNIFGDTAGHNIIGGTAAGAGNVIGGGIYDTVPGSEGHASRLALPTTRYSATRTDPTGTMALGNDRAGGWSSAGTG